MDDVKAVILETISPGGSRTSKRVFPTTKASYEKGKRVTWEWNQNNTYGEHWYKNPDTGKIEYGWGSSCEFVGRHLDEI